MADLQKLQEVVEVHERRLGDFAIWKAEISGSISEIRGWQERTCKEMTETRTEVVTKIDKMSETQLSIQLEDATEKGRKEQSNKNLYLFISLMSAIPTIAIIIANFGHK